MSERVEWRVVCADGTFPYEMDTESEAQVRRSDLDEYDSRRGPHRVQSRTVTTSEWVDECGDPRVEELTAGQGGGYVAACDCGHGFEIRRSEQEASDDLIDHVGEPE